MAPDPKRPPIRLPQGSDFQKQLVEGFRSKLPRNAILEIVKAFKRSAEFVAPTTTGTPFQRKLGQFSELIDEASLTNDLQPGVVRDLTERVFAASPQSLVQATEFVALKRNLRDSIVAVKLDQASSLASARRNS